MEKEGPNCTLDPEEGDDVDHLTLVLVDVSEDPKVGKYKDNKISAPEAEIWVMLFYRRSKARSRGGKITTEYYLDDFGNEEGEYLQSRSAPEAEIDESDVVVLNGSSFIDFLEKNVRTLPSSETGICSGGDGVEDGGGNAGEDRRRRGE
ncbi:hypothetical protein LXL04_012548 [Taraxacum kok-saghyz]